MTAAPPRRRPGPLLAPGAGGAVPSFLTFAALSLAASLIVVASLAAGRGALDLRDRLVGSATVVVRAAGLESPDAAAARAAERLGVVDGVARAWPLEPAGVDGLIARLVDGSSSGRGAPRLVAVEFKAGAAPRSAALLRALKADGLDAGLDDHRPWTSPIGRAAALSSLAAATLLAAIVALLAAMAAFTTGRRLAAQAGLVDLLRLSGAADGFIGGLFAAETARGAAWASAAGAAAAALAVAAWRLAGGAVEPIGGGVLAFNWADLAWVAPWPFIAAAAGALAARLAVRAALEDAP
jgi:cell division transport system permease protein